MTDSSHSDRRTASVRPARAPADVTCEEEIATFRNQERRETKNLFMRDRVDGDILLVTLCPNGVASPTHRDSGC